MGSYRDHPLSHLASVSPDGLRARADIWRTGSRWQPGPYTDPGDAVKDALLSAADHVEARRAALESLLSGDAEAAPGTARRTLAGHVGSGRPLPASSDLWGIARRLRAGRYPNDGGSTAASLESAADNLDLMAEALGAIAASPAGTASDEIAAMAKQGLGREAFVPTHEGSGMKM